MGWDGLVGWIGFVERWWWEEGRGGEEEGEEEEEEGGGEVKMPARERNNAKESGREHQPALVSSISLPTFPPQIAHCSFWLIV